jgi:hypothetical protein
LVVDDDSFESLFDTCVVPSYSPPSDSSLTDYLTFPYWPDEQFSISVFLQSVHSQNHRLTTSLPESGEALLAGSQDPFFWEPQHNLDADPVEHFRDVLDQELDGTTSQPLLNHLPASVPPSQSMSSVLDPIFPWDEPLPFPVTTPTDGNATRPQPQSSPGAEVDTGDVVFSGSPSSEDNFQQFADAFSSKRSHSSTHKFSNSPHRPDRVRSLDGYSCQWNNCLQSFNEIPHLR